MATIERLMRVTPAARDNVDGYDLVWRESPQSPDWLSAADMQRLYDRLPPAYRVIVDAAMGGGV